MTRINLSRINGKDNYGEEIIIPADKEKGFNFPFVLFIPDSLNNSSDLLVAIQTSKISRLGFEDSIKEILEHKDRANVINSTNIRIAQMFNSPILVPIIPRTKGLDSQYLGYALYHNDFNDAYTAVNRGSSMYKKEDYNNFIDLDKQIINMINYAKNYIFEKRNIVVEDKVILNGYSAASKFVNFFSALHPDIVSMVIGGGVGGTLIMPISNYNINGTNYEFTYPIGIKDVNFNLEEFKKIRHFYYIGKEDNSMGPARGRFELNLDENRNVVYDKYGNVTPKIDDKGNICYILSDKGEYLSMYDDGYYTDCQVNVLNQLVHDDAHNLFDFTKGIYEAMGIDAVFKYYPGDHFSVLENEELFEDINNFYNYYKNNKIKAKL